MTIVFDIVSGLLVLGKATSTHCRAFRQVLHELSAPNRSAQTGRGALRFKETAAHLAAGPNVLPARRRVRCDAEGPLILLHFARRNKPKLVNYVFRVLK
jgi:hypothetical protein